MQVWQTDAKGEYDMQKYHGEQMDMRGNFRCDAEGRFHFRTVMPLGYFIPMDGPVGGLIQAQRRHGCRPAHIHFLIGADGYRELVTAIYLGDDPHIDSDTVFGVSTLARGRCRATMIRTRRSRACRRSATISAWGSPPATKPAASEPIRRRSSRRRSRRHEPAARAPRPCRGASTISAAAAVEAAPPTKTVKLGVITDMSGSLSAQSGRGSVIAAQMAIEDCLAKECAGMSIELLSADHQNKPDIAVGIVRKWIDVDGVDAVTDIIQAAVQLAVQNLMKEKNRIALFPGGTARLANEDCAPQTSVLWMWDTYGQAVGITRPLATPDSSWFFIAADYAFGTSLIADATGLVRAGRRTRGRLGAASLQLRPAISRRSCCRRSPPAPAWSRSAAPGPI